jgi:putative nucleotidyltransferase with HDIG domain
MSIAERLAASPAVRAVRGALDDRDDVWIVGGAVREAVLRREVTDLDLAVGGDEREVAQTLRGVLGGPAFPLSAEFGTWRVLAGDGSWGVDVTRLRGETIEADLALRDFTINALAVPVADLEACIDPSGGLGDLDARLLRAVSDASFRDDPLRVLRAGRIAAGLGLAVDPGTAALARTEAPRAAEPAGERQLAELRLLMAGPDPLRGLELLDQLDATAHVLPEVEALRGVEQNPNHHLDVHGHTIEVLRRLLEVEADLGRYAGERAGDARALLDEPLGDEMSRRVALRFGALLHDIGKPATRGETGGYVTFIGHDREGRRLVGEVCERLKTSRAFRRHLEGLTMHHLRLGFLIREQPLPARRVHEYLRATEPVAADVTLLSVADRLAARGQGRVAASRMVEAHLELARRMLAAAIDWRREGPPRPPLRGDELAAALGIEPGPELGRLLAEIEAAQYAGEVTTREQAIEVARGSLPQ